MREVYTRYTVTVTACLTLRGTPESHDDAIAKASDAIEQELECVRGLKVASVDIDHDETLVDEE